MIQHKHLNTTLLYMQCSIYYYGEKGIYYKYEEKDNHHHFFAEPNKIESFLHCLPTNTLRVAVVNSFWQDTIMSSKWHDQQYHEWF